MSTDDEILAVAREGFLDEAKDMLRQFEDALLAMEQDPGDAEAVNCAFRAAHTIKGTAGLFGFEALVAFTHEVESLLECMRSGQLALSEEGMALLLQGRDQMERLLAEVAHGESSTEVAQLSETLGAQLRAHRGASGASTHAPHAEASSGLTTPAAPVLVASPWHISIRMGVDALRHGLDPMSFIRYLGSIGQVVGICTVTTGLTDLMTLDAESCHLGFEIRLQTQAGRSDIEQVFEFLSEDADIVYLPPDSPQDDYRALLNKRAPDPASL